MDTARTTVITHHKLKSSTSKTPTKLKYGKETFVFEAGRLVDYELDVPLESIERIGAAEFFKPQNKGRKKWTR